MGHLSGPVDATLFEVLRRHARVDPDRLWLTFERSDGAARSWSYGEFVGEVEGTINGLAALGLRHGSTFVVRVGLHRRPGRHEADST